MESKKADLMLIVITAIWGLSFPIMRNSLEYISEIIYLFYRFAVASFVLIILFHKKYKNIKLKTILKGMSMGIALSSGLGFTVLALQYTTASNVAFITGLNIVIVPFASSIILKKGVDVIKKISILIALVGLVLISGGVELVFNKGDFLALLCAVCISAQIILTDKYTQTEDPITLGCIQVNVAMIVYFFLCVSVERSLAFSLKSIVIITILITGIAGTALAFVGQTYVQRFTSPSHVAIIFILEPVFGAFFALIIPKLDGTVESISLIKFIGCSLLIISMLLSEVFSHCVSEEKQRGEKL